MKLKENMVVRCDTREKALEFLKRCYKQGIYFNSGSPIGDAINYWDDHKQDTCYSLQLGRNGKIIIRYGKKEYCIRKGFKIIDFDDLFKEKKKMNKCKVYEMPDYVGSNIKKVIINEPCVIVILNSGEKGVARCCPEDKFIEERGYKIALARAMKEKYLNNIAREDEIIKHYSHKFECRDSINKYLDRLYKLSYK